MLKQFFELASKGGVFFMSQLVGVLSWGDKSSEELSLFFSLTLSLSLSHSCSQAEDIASAEAQTGNQSISSPKFIELT